jgi:hypothetical protein
VVSLVTKYDLVGLWLGIWFLREAHSATIEIRRLGSDRVIAYSSISRIHCIWSIDDFLDCPARILTTLWIHDDGLRNH